MNFLEKLEAGWWWMGQIFEEWYWQMTHDDGEFFNYLQSDYCKYEEDMYYTNIPITKLTSYDFDSVKDSFL